MLGRLTIPKFDGTSNCSAKIWVQKLDTYFQLNPMTETDAIKLATLHLDWEAHEWWYHGLVTLGHKTITSYSDFTQRLMELFHKKDTDIHFRDLSQLKEIDSVETFISEFQRNVVMVSSMLESRLIMLFTKALSEPLCGWVKVYRPINLQDYISRTQDLQYSIPKNNLPQKPTHISKNKEKLANLSNNKEKIIPQKEWLNEDTRQDLRHKNLCFN